MKHRPWFVAAALTLGALAPPASAVIESLSLDYVFSGAPHPAPITAQFQDGFGSDTVRMTMNTSGLSGGEFISGWYFNLNPALDPTGLVFSLVSNPTQLTTANISTGAHAFKADGDGHYDMLFSFPTSGSSARFTANEQVVVDITRSAGLTLADFGYQSVESTGNGVYYSAAHIQNIGGSSSAWIGAPNLSPIPEPSAYAAGMGCSILGLIMLRRKFRRMT